MLTEFLTNAVNELMASSRWELAAVILAIAYLWLAMRQSQWCWPAAFVSTVIYTVLFWENALLMESLLNGYYLLMAVYGWQVWRSKNNGCQQRKITSWPWHKHLLMITGLFSISLTIGYFMANYTHADFAYLDSTTTVFAVFATWMVTQKVLENWLYWLVIDAASIYLYLEKSFHLTALLFMAYCVMAIVGYIQWRKHYQTDAYVHASA